MAQGIPHRAQRMLEEDSEPAYWNEERLRVLVLAPFLDALGLSPNAIRVEWSFSLHFGRSRRQLDGLPLRGQADALIRNESGDNLFIVELKRPGHTLTASDVDQGIHYARLLDQIAPFVIVSNGPDSHIYDTITKQRVDGQTFPTDSAFFRNGCVLATADDIAIRFEALEHFIGYSAQNIASFSRAQIEAGIRSLRERDGELGKYVPQVYVPRTHVRRALNEFLLNDAAAFALVGESGVGKTNEFCALAESLAETHVVLFFAGYTIHESLDEVLAREFNWAFSQKLDTPQIVRRLKRIAARTGKPVLLFIDALDESSTAGFPAIVSEFAHHVGAFAPHIRLLVSAKRTEWQRFARLHGNSSHLLLALSGTDSTPVPEGATWRPGQPVQIDKFTDAERNTALERYERVFNLAPVERNDARQLCLHPFAMRTLSETYRNRRPIVGPLGSDTLIRNWLDAKFAYAPDPNDPWSRVAAIAARIEQSIRAHADQSDGRRSLETIDGERLTPIALGDLVAHGILVHTVDEHRRSTYRFYDSQVLYFLIARHVLRLEQLSADAFRAALPALLETYALQGVLQWHLRDAPLTHWAVMDQELAGRALVFIETYASIFDRIAPALRPCVLPHLDGEIGIAYVAEHPAFVYFGLCVVGPKTPKRVNVLNLAGSNHKDPIDFLWNLGCVGNRGGGMSFANTDPKRAAALLAMEEIKQAIHHGALDERQLPAVMVESLLAIASYYENRRKLRLTGGPFQLLRRQGLLPLDLSDFGRQIQEYLGMSWYENEWAQEQFRSKSSYVTESEGGGASLDMAGFDRSAAAERVRTEVAAGRNFASAWFIRDRDLLHALTLIDQLRDQGITRIETDIFPQADRPTTMHFYSPLDSFSDDRLVAVIELLFQQGFAAFESLVETNLGRLALLMKRMGERPLRFVVGYTRKRGSRDQRWGWCHWGYTTNEGEATTVRVTLNPPQPFYSSDPPPDRAMRLGGVEVDFVCNTDLWFVFFPTDRVGFGRHAERGSGASRETPIRQFAYSILMEDWSAVRVEDILTLLDG